MDTIGFVGAGRMSTAIIAGLIREGFPAAKIGVCSKGGESALILSRKYQCKYYQSARDLFQNHDAVVLGIKPQQVKDLPAQLADISAGKLIFSVLAGTKISTLRRRFSNAQSIVRIMPNTPGQIGKGISGYSFEAPLSVVEEGLLSKVLSSMGASVKVCEDDLDAVTGVSGSGPAYVFEFIAALRDGGITNGLAADVSLQLAIETVNGAAQLLKETGNSPEDLRDAVTSPGGTTMAGLEVLKDKGFRSILEATVTAATERSRELAKNS